MNINFNRNIPLNYILIEQMKVLLYFKPPEHYHSVHNGLLIIIKDSIANLSN